MIQCVLQPDGRTSVRLAEARFNGPVSGSVMFQWLGSSGDTDSAILTDLYHTHQRARPSLHKWKIFTTDILDSEAGIAVYYLGRETLYLDEFISRGCLVFMLHQ